MTMPTSRRMLRRPRDLGVVATSPCVATTCYNNNIKLSSSSGAQWLLLLLALSNTLTQTSASYQYENPYANSNGYNGRYSSSSSYNGGSGSGVAYSYGGASQKMAMDVCPDSVVQVNKVEWSCDSPYTWYYGSGAHRNSATCDYGDKMSLTIKFQVVATIEDASVNDIFTTMAIYDDSDNLLSYTTPDYLCKNYVNADCTVAGTYSFTTKLTLTRPNSNGDDEVSVSGSSSSSNNNYYGYGVDSSYHGKVNNFYPVLSMAFSTKMDSGYNLGALNVECKEWNEQYPSYVEWSNQSNKTRTKEILGNYGMLLGTSLLLVCFVAFVWKQAVDAKHRRRGVEVAGGGYYNNNNLGYQQFEDDPTGPSAALQNYNYSQPPPPPPPPSMPPLSSTTSGTMAALYSATASSSSVGRSGSGTGSNLSPSHGGGDGTTPVDGNSSLPASLSSMSRQRQQEKLQEQHHQIT